MKLIDNIKHIFKKEEPMETVDSKDSELYDIFTSDEYRFLTEDKDKLASILEVAKLIYGSKECIIFSSTEEKPSVENITFYSLSDNPSPEFEMGSRDILINDLVNRVGPEEFDRNIEYYDRDRAMLYKEADYHILRADYFEKYAEYIRRINDPNGNMAPETSRLYAMVMDLKNKYENFT